MVSKRRMKRARVQYNWHRREYKRRFPRTHALRWPAWDKMTKSSKRDAVKSSRRLRDMPLSVYTSSGCVLMTEKRYRKWLSMQGGFFR